MPKLEEKKYPQENSRTEKFYPKKVIIPLAQHTGSLPELVVARKDSVGIGSLLAKSKSLISSDIHSPVSGKVLDIKDYNHPVLKRSRAVTVEASAEEDYPKKEKRDPDDLSGEQYVSIVQESGIVGLGGACFPTHIKLKPPKGIDTLIINGCECEPYLTSDFRLMVEHTESLIKGIEIVSKIIKPKKVIVALEDNEKEAIKRFNLKLHTKKYRLPNFSVKVLPTFYPQGSEKQLIYSTTGRVVPSGGLPFDVGCLVQNIATVFSVYEAVYFNKPLIERIVTFAGSALDEPKNLWIRIGTVLEELFSRNVLIFKKEPRKIIFGGPMMGHNVDSLDYPIIKGTSGVLFLSDEDLDLRQEQSCIKCARCVDACPMRLVPSEIARLVKNSMWAELDEFFISDCMECGSCGYVCPAKIPIVNYIKLGKEKLRKNKT